MSVVIGYVTDQFSVIMTDTRITYGKNGEYGWDDNYEKLASIPDMGWATGVGVCDFIERFKGGLSKSKNRTVGKIEELYAQTLEKEKQKHESLTEHIDSTVITCSWAGLEGNRMKLRVGFLNNEHFGHNLVELGQNQITILYPFDYLQDYRKIEDIEKRKRLHHRDEGSFERLLEHLLSIFAEISANSFGVSRICDIGIHMCSDNDVNKLKLKGEISPLMEAAREGTLMNMCSVVH